MFLDIESFYFAYPGKDAPWIIAGYNLTMLRVEAMLALIRMDDLADRHPYAISGGQQQRVAIARALAPNPKLLLLDEPFSNLDAKLKEELREEMRELLEKTDTTCIFVSHDLADLEAVCGRVESTGGA